MPYKLKSVFAAMLFVGLIDVANAVPVYLNDQNISVSQVSPASLTGGTIANVIDAPSASASENHTGFAHVWVSGGSLELDFDFGIEYDLTTLHFWNYFAENFDVDNIDFTFFDASRSLVGSLLNVMPQLGGAGGNPIFAENIPLSFPSNVQFVNAVLTGSNNEVDFNNIGFTGELSTNGADPTPVPEPGILVLLAIGGLGFAARRPKIC